MPQDEYLIAPAGEHWAVKLNAQILATFADRGRAIEAAVTAAQHSGEHGIAAQVLSQARDGNVQPIWTYGRDTYSRA